MFKKIAIAAFLSLGVTMAYSGERVPAAGSAEQIGRCEKLSKVQSFIERNGLGDNLRSGQMEQALRYAEIDPEQDPAVWGLPWGRFGAVFSSPWHISEYKKELKCGTTAGIDVKPEATMCLENAEDRFNLNDFNRYAPYKNGRLEFTPGSHEIGDGKGYMVFKSNSPAFNKKHVVENNLLSIEDLNFCSGAILSMKCRFGFMQTECILRENESVLTEEFAVRKKSLNKPYDVEISAKEFNAAAKELSSIIEADGFQFNGTEEVKSTPSGRVLQIDYMKYGKHRVSLLDCRIYGDQKGMYTKHECKEHRF